MKQHNVQEAYLKAFTENGKLWVYQKETRESRLQPPSLCTIEDDFQSKVLEYYQNTNIESPGINALRKLLNGRSIGENEFELIRYWSALHVIRNERFRSAPGISYNSDFNKLMDIENKFCLYYRYCFIFENPVGENFITSDNPVLELMIKDSIIRIITLTPHKLILLAHINDTISHEKLEFTEFVNSMIWGHAHKCVYSNQENLPISSYERNVKEWNFAPTMEQVRFIVDGE